MSARVGTATLLALACAYVALVAVLDCVPFLDAPNHLARAVILGDLWFDHGRRFGTFFTGDMRFAPYMLGDWLLAPLAYWLGPEVAGRVWAALQIAAAPAVTAVFLRAFGCRSWQVIVGASVALLLATDWFFLSGFGAFRIGFALSLLALAALRYGLAGSNRGLAAYVLFVVACYLVHPANFVMLGVAAVALALAAIARGKVSLLRAALFALPLAMLLAHYVALGSPGAAGDAAFGTLADKLMRLEAPLFRFSPWIDRALVVAIALAAIPAAASREGTFEDRERSLFLVVAGLFLLCYALLPMARGNAYDIDVRALPYAAVFGMLWVLRGMRPDAPSRTTVVLTFTACAANLAYLGAFLVPENARAQQYREAVRHLPPGTTFLPIATLPPVGRVQPLLHAHAWATIDRDARSPYLFSANRGDAMIHFEYRQRLPEPSIFWYVRRDMEPDWHAVAKAYRHVVMTRPFEARRIPLAARLLYENDVAAVFELADPGG